MWRKKLCQICRWLPPLYLVCFVLCVLTPTLFQKTDDTNDLFPGRQADLRRCRCGERRGRRKSMDILMPQLMKAAGVTEELKAFDPVKWVGMANACRAQAEEIISLQFSLQMIN